MPSVSVVQRAVFIPGVGDRVVHAKRMGALNDVPADRVVAVVAAASDRVDRVVQVFGIGKGVGPVGQRNTRIGQLAAVGRVVPLRRCVVVGLRWVLGACHG